MKLIKDGKTVEVSDDLVKHLINRYGWEELAEPTREELQVLLDEKNIEYDKRWGVKKLQELL